MYLPGGRPSRNGSDSDALEAFARSLWMAAPYLVGHPDGRAEIGGQPIDLAAFYRRGFVAGTDPRHAESWHRLLPVPQTLVEAAPLAVNLLLARRALWDPLSDGERERILAWFEAVTRIEPADTNWRLFAVAVQTVLKHLGGRYSQASIDAHLDRVETFYLGDGWYADGDPRSPRGLRLDYYNAWVIHPLLLWWSLLEQDEQPARAARIRDRAAEFVGTFAHWVGADGSIPCFGRSVLYRMAAAGVFPAAVMAGACPLPPGQTRRLCSAVLRYFLALRGTRTWQGQLTMGFGRTYLAATEPYSGPGSPYWAGLIFAALAIPDTHPFWQAPEETLPVERGDYTITIPAAGFLIHGCRETGQVQVLNGASVKFAKKYTNLAYSTHFGFEVTGHQPAGSPDPAGDACLTLSRDGITWYGRRHGRVLAADGDALLMEAEHVVGDDGRVPPVRVITAAAFAGEQQVRVSRVEAGYPVLVREGGFACGWDGHETPTLLSGRVSCVVTRGAVSGIRPLLGYDDAPAPVRSDRNVLHARSAVPFVRTTTARSGAFYLASVSLGRPAPFDPERIGDRSDAMVARLSALVQRVPESHTADAYLPAGAVGRHPA